MMSFFVTKTYWGYLAALAIVHIILTSYTPLIIDDWYQCFVFGTDRYMESFDDFIQSRYNHYMTQNGRVFPETLANLFGVFGKGYFNVLNGIMFAVFVHTIIRNFGSGVKHRLQNAVVLSFLIVLLYPGFTDCFLWMSGSCNYLWSAVTVLLYWDRYKKMTQANVAQCILLFVLGIMCGVCNEAIVFPFVLGICLYSVFHWRKLKAVHYCMLIGLVVGSVFLITCPALWERVAIQESKQSLGSVMIATVRLSYRLETILLVFLAFFVICAWRYKHMCVDFVKSNSILLLMLCVSFFLILYSRSLYERTNFCTNLLSMILVLQLVSFLLNMIRKRWRKYIIMLLAVCSMTTPLFSIPCCVKNYQEYKNIDQILTTNYCGIVPTCEVQPYGLASRFVGRCIPADNNGFEKTYDSCFYVNKYISNFYHKSSVVFVPSVILKDIKDGLITEEFSNNKEYPYYIRRQKEHVNQVIYKLHPVKKDDIPFMLRYVSHYMGKYSFVEVEASCYGIVIIDGVSYLFVDRNENIDDRVEQIDVR